MEKFGEKLRSLRKQRGLAITELGDMLGVSYSYVGKLERGEKIPNVAMLIKIADVFNISLDNLARDELDLD